MRAALPVRPSLDWLRKTAKEHLRALRQTRPAAKLAEAQLALARSYGFSSWRRLKAQVERIAAPPPRVTDDEVAAFLRLVATGELDAVRAALDAQPALVNAVGPHPFWGGRPQPLHVAIETRRRPVFDLLIERGADIDGRNDQYDHWSPLMVATGGTPDLRDVLVRRGARIGLVEALLLADDEAVAARLEPGVLPAVVPNGGSLLMFARTPWAIDHLIALGASTDLPDRWGCTPVEALSRLGPRGQVLVGHLRGHGVIADPAVYARLGDLATLTRLAQTRPAIVADGAVVFAAVDAGRHAVVDWLLAQGASVNVRIDAESRHTALHAAAWNGDLPMVERLVDRGADLDARDAQYDATPLGWAMTAIKVTSNPACAAVVTYLTRRGTA